MHHTAIFQTLAQNIETTIAEHSHQATSALMLTHAQKQKLLKAAEDLEFLRAIKLSLPDSLEFCTLPSARVANSISQKLRKEFKNAVKPAYIQHIASTPEHRQAFMKMGLTDAEIETLATNGLTRDVKRNGQQLDMIIDHIHDLTLGGQNTFDNFMLIPDYLNQIKARLIHIQERVAPECEARISLKPKAASAIPFIETGFRPMTSGKKLCQQVNDFLDLER